jgi:hypothetical protein
MLCAYKVGDIFIILANVNAMRMASLTGMSCAFHFARFRYYSYTCNGPHLIFPLQFACLRVPETTTLLASILN